MEPPTDANIVKMEGIPTEPMPQREHAEPVSDSQVFGSSSTSYLRDQHNIVQSGMTSVKVHHRPGGPSNIDIFGQNNYGEKNLPSVPVKIQSTPAPQEESKGPIAGKATPMNEGTGWFQMDVPKSAHEISSTNQDSNSLATFSGSTQEPECHGASSGHVLRTQHNIGGEGGPLTSVKVHQAPGGNSNFAISSDSQWTGQAKNQTPFHHSPEKVEPAKNQHHQSSFSFKHDPLPIPTAQPTSQGHPMPLIGQGVAPAEVHSGKQMYEQKHDNVYTGGSQWGGNKGQHDGPAKPHSSVKIHNPPGGRSNITFG